MLTFALTFNKNIMIATRYIYFTLMFLGIVFSSRAQNQPALTDTEENIAQDVIWHVKALHPEGYTMDVKAIDEQHNQYDIKAIENSNQRYIMDVKAFVGKEVFPVKVLVSEDEYKPVVAIVGQGKTYSLIAIDKNGKHLKVKGVRKTGYIIHIKAVGENGELYGVKSISKKGKLNDVKGIKMYDKRLEITMEGVEVHAHVVALPQVQ